MFSLYGINWVELSKTDKLCVIGFFAIMLIVCVVYYIYDEYKGKGDYK